MRHGHGAASLESYLAKTSTKQIGVGSDAVVVHCTVVVVGTTVLVVFYNIDGPQCFVGVEIVAGY